MRIGTSLNVLAPLAFMTYSILCYQVHCSRNSLRLESRLVWNTRGAEDHDQQGLDFVRMLHLLPVTLLDQAHTSHHARWFAVTTKRDYRWVHVIHLHLHAVTRGYNVVSHCVTVLRVLRIREAYLPLM